jgi:hypothetical protein
MCVYQKGPEYDESVKRWFKRQLDCEVCPLFYNWPGWWAKMNLFHPDIEGDVLYFDLDTVINGDISKYTELEKSHVLEDFFSPYVSIGSGMMYLTEEDRMRVWDDWIKNPQDHMSRYRGDQDYLKKFFWDAKRWQHEFPGEIISYKKHLTLSCRHYVPGYSEDKANVICFHGQPRPWKVEKYA